MSLHTLSTNICSLVLGCFIHSLLLFQNTTLLFYIFLNISAKIVSIIGLIGVPCPSEYYYVLYFDSTFDIYSKIAV